MGAAADFGRGAQGHLPRTPAVHHGQTAPGERLSRRERALPLGARRRGEARGGGVNSAVERATRGPFDGVLQIVRYNWSLYVAAILGAVIVVGFVVVVHPPTVLADLLMLGAIAALFWLTLSLAVSHYVYARSDLYQWQWIREWVVRNSSHVVNIHAGLDETSLALQEI